MSTANPPVPQQAVDVTIVGAGPVGLMIANTLGLYGVRVLLVEKLPTLIDYPRAIGLDDEALRTFQGVGLAEAVLPHTTPNHWMRFTTPSGRCFASIEPRTDEFGWSRRNAFIQPLADEILHRGLARFPRVTVLFSHAVADFTQDEEGVTLDLESADGVRRTVRTRYLVGCDGGRSAVREKLGISFEGKTAPNKWIVVDVRNDPLGTPHVYLHCDPKRPYVSAALPHGIRRFEFMVMPHETEEELSKPESLTALLSTVVPHPEKVDFIRQRVYTHNARLASRFRAGRVVLAGDAAHIMPVWQGQGYNSGIRDAANLAWKLALVVKGIAADGLLDTYDVERRDHARSMIDLSVTAGRIFAPKSRLVGKLRDALTLVLNAVPPVKRYFLEMRFKPMPRYKEGVVIAAPSDGQASPVGRMFIQPRVLTEDGTTALLDDVIGPSFAVIAWGTDPTHGMTPGARAFWERLGTRMITAKPVAQLVPEAKFTGGVTTIGDIGDRLRTWFGSQPRSIVILRPDRFVAALTSPQTITEATAAIAQVLRVPLQAPAADAAPPIAMREAA